MRHEAYIKHGGIYPATGKPMPVQYSKPFAQIQLIPERLNWPLTQKKPLRIFVDSMSDLFHSQIEDDYIRQVFAVMRAAHWHTFQVLAKRAGRLRRLGPTLSWSPNIWIGVSIENDLVAPRADALRGLPAEVCYLSCEPFLGALPSLNLAGIHWVITGGESGPGARPCDLDGVRNLRDRCMTSGVAFFHKQMGTVWAKSNHLKQDTHGSNMDNWPADLRIRQFPVQERGIVNATLF
jgi:protein gp37